MLCPLIPKRSERRTDLLIAPSPIHDPMTTIPAPQAVDLDSVRAAWRKRLRKAYIAQPPAWWLLQLGLDDMSAAFQQLPPFYDHLSVPDAVKVFVGLAGIRDSLTPVMRRYLAIATNLEATSRWDNVPPSDRTEAGDLCPICADEYDPDHTVVRAACAHILHRDCLEVSVKLVQG